MFAECPCAGSEAGRTFLCCFFEQYLILLRLTSIFFSLQLFLKKRTHGLRIQFIMTGKQGGESSSSIGLGAWSGGSHSIHRKEAERECWSSTHLSLYAAHHPSPWDDASTFTVGLSSSGKPRTDFNLVQLTRKTDYHRKFCTKPHNFSTNEIRTLVLRTRDNYAYSFYLQDAELLIFLYLPSHSCDYKHMLLYKWDWTQGLMNAKPEF